MNRREDYLGCRVSERRYPVKYKVVDGVRIPYHIREHQFPSPADNYSTTTNEVSEFEQAVFEELVYNMFQCIRRVSTYKKNSRLVLGMTADETAHLSPSERFELDVLLVFEQASSILISKNKDYGSRNIADAPGGPLNGLRVRIHDKTARINNLIDSGKDPQHESLRDSFLDLMNYAAIALLVIDGDWPGVEPDDTEADCG